MTKIFALLALSLSSTAFGSTQTILCSTPAERIEVNIFGFMNDTATAVSRDAGMMPTTARVSVTTTWATTASTRPEVLMGVWNQNPADSNFSLLQAVSQEGKSKRYILLPKSELGRSSGKFEAQVIANTDFGAPTLTKATCTSQFSK